MGLFRCLSAVCERGPDNSSIKHTKTHKMSVPAFIDITEEDQASELRAYLKSKGAEISEENSEGGLHVDLAQIIEACDVCLKDDDKDVESVMNSIVSLLLILETEKQEALIESLCEKLVSIVKENDPPSGCSC